MPPGSPLRAAWRGAAFLTLTLLLVPVYGLASLLARGRPVALLWCRATCAILGIRLRVAGAPFAACPTLYVANHVSYLDIPVLGALLDATFVAKAEVAAWPLFGLLGRLSGTFFVRRRRLDALVQRNALAARLRAGESFVLFAEGTSTDGRDVLPFRTSLLSVCEPWVLDRPVAVQPVTLAYRRLGDGTPVDARNGGLYAWYGDATFLPHLLGVLAGPGIEIAVHLGEPVLSWAVTGRKRLGRDLHGLVQRRLMALRLPVSADILTECPALRPVLEGLQERSG